ncbi:MAG: M4 family metallopeptidase [Mycolicibacterium sp.]|uniref:M4 family metallopeptidase n=1 Tax=Mycolicibacterium sp. TaxID=2320850 RepID=UPI003D13D261
MSLAAGTMSVAAGPGIAGAAPSDSSESPRSAETPASLNASRSVSPTASPGGVEAAGPDSADAVGDESGTVAGDAAEGARDEADEEALNEVAKYAGEDVTEKSGREDATGLDAVHGVSTNAVNADVVAAGVVEADFVEADVVIPGVVDRSGTAETDADDTPDSGTARPRRDAKAAQNPERPAESGDQGPAAESPESQPHSFGPGSTMDAAAGPDSATFAAGPALVTTDLSARAAPAGEPTLGGLARARPVTVNGIVTDLLTWVGLGPLANGLPTPAAPVPALIQSLWLAVRQAQYTLNNQRPIAEATMSGPGPDGVVSGSINAVDYDDPVLTYRVTAAPTRGSVVIDALGNFTYTPAGASSAGDRFTVTVDDTVGNPFHVHGLLGALGITGPTEVTIVIAPSAARRDRPASLDLDDPLSRDRVQLTMDINGALSVIDGRFTDHPVTTAADAAAVMNALAPVLGLAVGFADPAAVTVAHAGVGSSAESFYRLSETIDGIKVLGSEMILVTDAGGAVTGLFDNYRGLAEGFDVTPDRMVDEDIEVYLIAGTAYLGPGADLEAIDAFLAQNTFTNQLVVHALDDEAEPSLAWRVVVQFPDTGDMSRPGASYLIDADGADAGTVIVSMANASDASTVTVAKDWLGDERTITVDSSSFLFFTSHKMFDAGRGITTYRTWFPLYGFAGSILPGTVVKRSWLSWDRAAVSAHANTAVVYDYFRDVLGRTSFDGAGAPITVSIRYNPGPPIFGGYSNAFWDPSLQQFAYGDSGYLQAALDVVAHEFTHGVVSYVVGDGGSVLDYGESGALNEAMADIFGVLIEGKSGQDRWLIAEDSRRGVLRNLADPTAVSTAYGRYRDHYSTRYTGSGDDGGEHVNSTIFSHAAYRMMTSADTGAIPDETWATLFYQSLYRLSPGADFVDGRAAVLSTAAALEFTDAQLDAIRDAFDSVGILEVAPASAIAA